MLVARMLELVKGHPRHGYRRIWALLRREGWRVNRKRIYRLWRREGLRVPRKQRKRGRLGSGGMGQVWKAADTQLHNRPVAIKRVHSHLLATAEALQRFDREVHALAALNHPHIVSVTDIRHSV